MISYREKFIFVHIYKTAGSSVRHALQPAVNGMSMKKSRAKKIKRKIFGRREYKYPSLDLWDHAGANEFKVYLGEEYDDFFSFAFVRNPFDWQVSLYEFIRKSSGHHLHKMAQKITFKDFLKSRVVETQRPQKDFICDMDGNIIIDKIGRFETLRDDFGEICKRIGITTDLPHLNRSTRKSIDEYYDAEARDIVLSNFEADFQMFGYSDKLG